MATVSEKHGAEHWFEKLMRLKTLRNTKSLMERLRDGTALQDYISRRWPLLAPVVFIMLLISIVCTTAIFVSTGKVHSLLMLLAIVVAPVILLGSAFVQLYAFLHWIEGRIMTRALRSRAKTGTRVRASWSKRKLGIDLGPFPPVPWVLATVTLFFPLAVLFTIAWKAVLAIVIVAVLIPVAYAVIDR